jgi:hypothetical protein
MNESTENKSIVLGQKYAYATASLLIGISSYIHLLGIERAVLAILFAWLALRSAPAPRLPARRLWAQVGMILGLVMLVIVPGVVIWKFESFRELIMTLENLQ